MTSMDSEEKKNKINDFLALLKSQSANEFGKDTEEDVQDIFSNQFLILCRKCGSEKVFVSFDPGCDYGGYTGYSPGQKLFKCNDCGNAASFWE